MKNEGRWKRILRRSLLGFGVILLFGLIASWVEGGRLVAPQPHVVGEPPADFPATSIALKNEVGERTFGWHFRSDQAKGVVVLLHPIRTSRLYMLERARLLKRAGYSIVMIDLQAHGESPGKNITLGHLERYDAKAAVEFARRVHPTEPVAVIGVSLGGVASVLASPLGIDALVLEGVFPALENAIRNRVAERLGPLSGVPSELLLAQIKPRLRVSVSDLKPIEKVAVVGCPVFFISGEEDKHTTAEETKAMFATARHPKELWLVSCAGHVNLQRAAPREYETRVLAFLKQHMVKER